VGDQPQIPGKSVTDLLTQAFLRVAGPSTEPRNPYRRDDEDAHRPPWVEDAEAEADDDVEWEYEEYFEEVDDDGSSGPDADEDEQDDRRDDNDLYRI
jgi:hypothetical protein